MEMTRRIDNDRPIWKISLERLRMIRREFSNIYSAPDKIEGFHLKIDAGAGLNLNEVEKIREEAQYICSLHPEWKSETRKEWKNTINIVSRDIRKESLSWAESTLQTEVFADYIDLQKVANDVLHICSKYNYYPDFSLVVNRELAASIAFYFI